MIAAVTNAAGVLGAIAWDPEIRNILGLLVGILVLCGSVYLIVATNTGKRTGLLIAIAALCGWIMTMGIIWWIYGIGMKGEEPSWKVTEINYSAPDFSGLHETVNKEARDLVGLDEVPTAQEVLEQRPELVDEILPPDMPADEREARTKLITLGQIIEADPGLVDELGIDDKLDGWRLLPVSDRQRGDAVATADAFLGPDGRGLFESSAGYAVVDTFSEGGKPRLPDNPSRWDRITHKLSSIVKPFHPTHYAAVQVRAVIPTCAEDETSTAANPCITVQPGEAAPPPQIDERAPLVTVIMVRDLGDKRFPAFMVTIIFGALFALTCWTLHRRDQVIARARAATV